MRLPLSLRRMLRDGLTNHTWTAAGRARGFRVPNLLFRSILARRWIIAALVIVLAAIYGEVALYQRLQPVDLGVQVGLASGVNIVTRVQPAGPAWVAGIRPGDRVIALDVGSADADRPGRFQSLTVQTQAGELRTVARDAPETRSAPFRWAAFLVIAASFLVVGLGVFVLSRPASGALSLLAMNLSAALALLSAIATPTGAPWALAGVNLGLIGFGIATPLLFLGLAFPNLAPRARLLASGFSGAVATLLLAGYSISFFGDGHWYDVYRPWLLGTLLVALLTACALAVLALVRTDVRRSDRVALQITALGVCGGVLPFCLLVLIPGALGWQLPYPPELPALVLIVLPVSLGLAVLTRQWLAVERIAQRSVVALSVWSLLLLGYTLLIDVLQRAIAADTGALAAIVHGTAFQVALVAGSFPLVQHVMRQWAEERIFHPGEAPAVQLQRLQSALAQAHDVDTIATTALSQLGTTLAPSALRLTLPASPGERRRYRWPGDVRANPASTTLRTTSDTPQPWRRFVLRAHGEVVGILAIARRGSDEWPPEGAAVVAGTLPMLAVTLANALLLERLRQQVQLLGEREQALARLSTQLLQAQEDERRRLAFDLHDDPLQRTILLARDLADVSKTSHTERWRETVTEIASSLRALCASLRPPMLDDLGLAPALAWLANDVRARSDLAVDLMIDPAVEETPLAPDLAVALYRVTQEALNNCLKHAQATQVSITVTCAGPRLELRIADNGQGYTHSEGHHSRSGLGIAGMHERLRPLGGKLTVRQGAEGGTVVTALVPMQEQDDEHSATTTALAHHHRG